MEERSRKTLYFIVVALSLTLLAAPARGAEFVGVQLGGGGFSISLGASNWAVYGSSWSNPNWQMDYHVALSGYGNWVWVNGLGQCWRPSVAVGWRPYTHGRWVWSSYGWTWVAYEPWGYFPHHYGHWAMSHQGWVWVPGYTYRPANVTWVTSGGFLGWYACPPPGWSHAARGYGHGYDHGYRHGYGNGYRGGYDDGYWSGWNDARYATYSQWSNLGAEDLSRHAVTASTVRASTSAKPRIVDRAPDRPALARRGVVLPEKTMETRTVRVGDRDVTVARPSGIQDMIQRHGERTVERALAPEGRATVKEQSVRARGSSTTAPRDYPTTAERTTKITHDNIPATRKTDTNDVARTSSTTFRQYAADNAGRPTSTGRQSDPDGRARHSNSTTTSEPGRQRTAPRVVPTTSRHHATASGSTHDSTSRVATETTRARSGSRATGDFLNRSGAARTPATVNKEPSRLVEPSSEPPKSGESTRSREGETTAQDNSKRTKGSRQRSRHQ